MEDKRAWNDIHGKAQGAGIGGALGVITIIVVDAVAGLDAVVSGILVASLAAVFAYLLPDTPPWKK